MTGRFTLDGSEALERHLAETGEATAQAVQKLFPEPPEPGLLLGGGYGRGEGGVLRTPSRDLPYNDLEFYLFLPGMNWLNEKKHGPAVHHLAEELTPAAGVELEIKIISKPKLEKSGVTMFYYDLVMGHRQFLGKQDLLAGCDHHRRAEEIPLCEATRLLMNRCTGLLFSGEKLDSKNWGEEAADFVGRNLAKAQLGFGDAYLSALGQYHWSCRERSRRLGALPADQSVPWLGELQKHHHQGVEFKLHPRKRVGSAAEFRRELDSLKELGSRLWLWLESKRLRQAFSTVEEYAWWPGNKCPETNPMRNQIINLRAFRGRGVSGRYPRERLLNALPLLLWSSNALRETRQLQQIQDQLRSSQQSLPGLLDDYRTLWRRFN